MAYLPGQNAIRTLTIPALAIATSGSPADLGSVAVPTDISRYAITGAWAFSVSAVGALTLATVDLRTAAAGGGASILTAPVALTGLTALNLSQALLPAALGTTYSSSSIFVRQTVDSGNAAVLNIVLQIVKLS